MRWYFGLVKVRRLLSCCKRCRVFTGFAAKVTRVVLFYTPWLGGPGSRQPVPRLTPFFHVGDAEEIVIESGLQERRLRYPLSIWYSKMAFRTQSPVNLAIGQLRGGQSSSAWYGTVVVLRYSGHKRLMFSDICDSDMATLSVYLLELM